MRASRLSVVVLVVFVLTLTAFAPIDAYKPPSGPDCLQEPGRSAPYRTQPVTFTGAHGAQLAGTLHLPQEKGRYPGLALMHGGGSNIEVLRSTPSWFAEMAVRCGFAVITWDKHGLGESGGDYASSTMDTFVEDAGAAGKLLSRHEEVDDSRIGILGFSQGGRLAPVVANRYPHYAFAASVSGPIASVKETRLYALELDWRRLGVAESSIQGVMPLWNRYLTALGDDDAEAMAEVAADVAAHDDGYRGQLLPPGPDDTPRDGIFNSMGRDYIEELVNLQTPWFSLFGGADRIVPVDVSIANIDRIKKASGNEAISYTVIEGAGHSFSYQDGREGMHRFDLDMLAWIMEQADIPIHIEGH